MKDYDCAIGALALLTERNYIEIQEMVGADPRTLNFESREAMEAVSKIVGKRSLDSIYADSKIMAKIEEFSPITMGTDMYQIMHTLMRCNMPALFFVTQEGAPDPNEAALRNYPTSDGVKQMLEQNSCQAFLGITPVHSVFFRIDKQIVDLSKQEKELKDLTITYAAVVPMKRKKPEYTH